MKYFDPDGQLNFTVTGKGLPHTLIVTQRQCLTFSRSSDFLNFMRDDKRPVISPYRNAVYSDAGFAILGQVLARLAGKKTYSEAIRETIFKPLGLDSTSTSAPKGTGLNAINRKLIDTNSSWGLDLEVVASYVFSMTFYFIYSTWKRKLTTIQIRRYLREWCRPSDGRSIHSQLRAPLPHQYLRVDETSWWHRLSS